MVVVVHPDDVNHADAKAMAAQYDASVVGNPWCPRGAAFLMKDPRDLLDTHGNGPPPPKG